MSHDRLIALAIFFAAWVVCVWKANDDRYHADTGLWGMFAWWTGAGAFIAAVAP